MNRWWLAGLVVFVFLAGCSSLHCTTEEPAMLPPQPRIITVTGYGALDPSISNQAQQHLMALRASEVDAFRALAERIRGLQITSNTKVDDFIARYDQVNTMVDTYVAAAKIVSQSTRENGICETVLRVDLDGPFFEALQSPTKAVIDTPRPKPANDEVLGPNLPTVDITGQHLELGETLAAEGGA